MSALTPEEIAALEKLGSNDLVEHVEELIKVKLAETAAWVADDIGYPVELSMPGVPTPDALWEAIVDHVHADQGGTWHGNELDRDEVRSWLEDEAGRDNV